jgi:hypothetical protein
MPHSRGTVIAGKPIKSTCKLTNIIDALHSLTITADELFCVY